MATAPKFVPPLPIHVTVPPAQDISLVYGQEAIFESMTQSFNICFGVDANWPSLSGKVFSNQGQFTITAPNVTTTIPYNVVLAGNNCTAIADVPKSIHVSSGGLHKR